MARALDNAKNFLAGSFLSGRLFSFLYVLSLGAYGFWLWGGLPFHSDNLTYVYPEKAFTLRCLREGLLPLWDPDLACGVPHLADWQSSVFYPPNLLLAWADVRTGLLALVLSHLAWAYAGFFLWARSQKAEGWLSALGALSFAGSAHFACLWTNAPLLCTASWIPWVFLGVDRALVRKTPLADGAAAAVLALQLLAGYPIFVFYTWILLVIRALFRHPDRGSLARLGLILGASLLATSCQWLPFLGYLCYAQHGGWADFPYHLRFRDLPTLFQPTHLGFPGDVHYRGNAANAIYENLYFGLLACLAWAASLVRPFRSGRFFAAASAFLLAWMMGSSLWIWGFIPNGLWNLLEPSKSVGIFLFTACTSACLFLQGWRAHGPFRPWMAFACLLWALDLLTLPLSQVLRVPDPFQDPAIRHEAQWLEGLAQGRRILSLNSPGQTQARAADLTQASTEVARRLIGRFTANSNSVWGLRSPDAYLSTRTEGLKNSLLYIARGFPYRGDWWDIAGVRVLLAPRPLAGPQDRPLGTRWGEKVFISSAASPDLRWVGQAEAFPSRASILERIARPGNPWRRVVYLEKDPDGSDRRLDPAPHPRGFDPVTEARHPTATRASFPSGSPQAGYIVFDESFAPGWHAWVDGRPRPILRAYGLFMAVAVEAGPHQVDFRYDPAGFRAGLFLSLAAWGLACVFLLGPPRKKAAVLPGRRSAPRRRK